MSDPHSHELPGSLNGTALLDHLPVPCIYLTTDHRIAYYNTAARDVIRAKGSIEQHGTSSSYTSIARSILETEFVDIQVKSKHELEQGLNDVATAFGDAMLTTGDQNQSRLNGAEGQAHSISLQSGPTSNWQWTLSSCVIDTLPFLCLTGSVPTPPPSWKTTELTRNEEHELFHSLADPSWRDVPYATSLMYADSNTFQVNEHGRGSLGELARAMTDGDEPSEQHLNVWDEAFNDRKALSDAAGPTTLKSRKGILSLKYGLEDPTTGARSIIDSTCTLLNNPFNDKPLGVIIQAREPQEWAKYIEQNDILSRSYWTTAGARPIMVRTMKSNGIIDYFSDSWEAFAGHTRSRLCQGYWKECIHPDDLPKLQAAVSSSIRYVHVSDCKIRIRHREGGAYRYFTDRIVPFRDFGDHSNRQRWYVITTDIHDLLMRQKLAQRSTERLYNLVNNMPVNMFTLDEDLCIRSSQGALKLDSKGGRLYESVDYEGRGLHEVVGELANTNGINEVVAELEKVAARELDFMITEHQVGGKYLRTFAVPEADEEDLLGAGRKARRGVLALTMDLTAEVSNEKAIHKIKIMQEAERMKDQFLANMSHELRTPIAGLLGMTDLLIETELSPKQSDYVHTFQSSARSLLTIVNNILDFSKAQADAIVLERLSFDFPRLLHDICNTNENLAMKKGLSFHLETPSEPLTLLGDPGRIRQILQNMITNAIKFTSTGYVKLSASYEQHDGIVKVIAVVEDTGIGIDDETLKRLFKPFVQADQSTTRVYGGSGLGLSIARKLAQAMDGDVVLESQKGRGTKAHIILQLEGPQQSTSRESLAGSCSTSNRSNKSQDDQAHVSNLLEDAHILLVEDNLVNKKVVLAHLEKLGVRHLDWVGNGADAVEYVDAAMKQDGGPRSRVRPDLILMDCQMPVLDGYDATRRLRTELKYEGPIVALTASAIEGDRKKCLDAGMDDHLIKPMSRKQLSQTIQKWLSSSRPAA